MMPLQPTLPPRYHGHRVWRGTMSGDQRPTTVPFPSGVDEYLRSQVVELRRYVDHLEAERDLERKKSEAILEVGTKIDAGQRGTPTQVEESFVEKEKEKL